MVPTTDFRVLTSFIRGDLDVVACPACQTAQQSAPAVVVSGDDWAGVTPSEYLGADDALALASLAGAPETVIHDDVAALCANVRARLTLHLVRVAPLFSQLAFPDDVLRGAYRECTAELVSALGLMRLGLLDTPRTMAHLVDDEQPSLTYPSELSSIQHQALLIMAAELSDDESLSLVVQMERFVSASTVPLETLALLDGAIDELLEPAFNLDNYITRAVQALAHLTVGSPNPRADEWTRQYVAFSLARSEPLERFVVRPEQAKSTLDVAELCDVVRETLRHGRSAMERLGHVYDAAGFPDLIDEMLGSREVDVARSQSPSEIIAHDYSTLRPAVALEGLRELFRGLIHNGRTDEVEPLADLARAHTDDSADTRAGIEACLGEVLTNAHAASRFLARVGAVPQAWELEASTAARLALGVERTRALAACGRDIEARDLTISLMKLADAHGSRRVLEKNLAVALQRTGEPERAVAILKSLIGEASGSLRLDILEALLVAYSRLGRTADAQLAAHQIVEGPHFGGWVDRSVTAKAFLIASAAATGDVEEAVQGLGLIDYEAADPRVPAIAAGAWLHLVRRRVPGLDIENLNALLTTLARRAGTAKECGDVVIELDLTRALALLLEEFDKPDAEDVWRRRMTIFEHRGTDDALTLIFLARHCFASGNADEARSLIQRVPAALRQQFGQLQDATSGFASGSQIRNALARLADTLVRAGATPADITLIAELQRNGRGGSKVLGQVHDDPGLPAAFSEDALKSVCPDAGKLHVVEWLQIGNGIGAWLTTIEPAGSVTTVHIGAPRMGVFINELGETLKRRLDGWLPSRPGDPLDYRPWHIFEEWLLERVGSGGPYEHVVFFGHEFLDGVPLHAIRGANWSSSYAADWSHLLSLPARTPASELLARGLGVVSVNARDDDPIVVDEFTRSVQRLREMAAECQCPFDLLDGTAGTAERVLDLMSRCGILFIQAHGYSSPQDDAVAFLLASRGQLPVQHAVAAATKGDMQARFSWQRASRVLAAPALVLSGACSTGSPLRRGLGESVGLHSALRPRGTRAVIAPAWDVQADDALPLLSDALAEYLGGKGTLAQCLRAASEAAEAQKPRWQAWALALEGDWR